MISGENIIAIIGIVNVVILAVIIYWVVKKFELEI